MRKCIDIEAAVMQQDWDEDRDGLRYGYPNPYDSFSYTKETEELPDAEV